MHIRFDDKTIVRELELQPNESNEELARQIGVPVKRIEKLRDRIKTLEPKKTYFIMDEQGKVKIGCSVNPYKRLIDIQSDNSGKVILLGFCDDEESEVHDLFDQYRVRGEWFKLSDELMSWIKENTQI